MSGPLRFCSQSHRTPRASWIWKEELSSIERPLDRRSASRSHHNARQRTGGVGQHTNIFLHTSRGDASADGGDLAIYTIRQEKASASRNLQMIDGLGLRAPT